jgi:receptor protein-tyrosine kinase
MVNDQSMSECVAEERAMTSVTPLVEKIASAPNRLDRQLGKLLLESGKITAKHIEAIIALQQEQPLLFGDAALKLGFVQEDDLLQALSRQFEYPCFIDGESKLSQRLVVALQPFGAKAERYRALRSDLVLNGFSGEARSLAIVPAQTGQSAIDVAANLAVAFAQLGESTLLIDADMRQPCLQELFRVRAVPGLSDVLIGRTPLKQAIAQVEAFSTLSILCAGAAPPNPQELLSRPIFSSLLDIASRIHDVVILIAPPADQFADAQIIAARASSCLLAVELHKSRYADVKRVAERFSANNIALAGAVVAE